MMKPFSKLIIVSIVMQTVYSYCPKKCLCRKGLLYCQYQNIVNEDLKLIVNNMPNNIKTLSLTGNLLDENSLQLIKKFKKLEYLYLTSNRFRSIPQNISVLFPNLKKIYLDSNQIKILPRLEGFGNIKVLNLKHNNISDVSENLFSNKVNHKLEELYVSFNHITKIPCNFFKGVTHVSKLLLDNNFIETITKCMFANLVQLKELYLQSNLISKIESDTLVELKSLKHFYLYNNKLQNISTNLFKDLPLEVVNLRQNQLQDISFLYYLTKRTYCYLEMNRFECNCKIVTYLQKFNYKRISLGLCYNRYEKKFVKYSLKQLNCDKRYIEIEQTKPPISANSETTNQSTKGIVALNLGNNTHTPGELKNNLEKNVDGSSEKAKSTISLIVILAVILAVIAIATFVFAIVSYMKQKKSQKIYFNTRIDPFHDQMIFL